MIGYTAGTNDLPRATQKFYDELLAMVGASARMEFDRGIAWRCRRTTPGFGVMKPSMAIRPPSAMA